MKKIPTLFERQFEDHKVVGITDKVTPGCEAALDGTALATIKYDGSCCAVINGEFYKRYDAKKGKTPPEGAIPCCDPDPVTGHWPHWVKVDVGNPADRWFIQAFANYQGYNAITEVPDGTYEAIGLHFQGNPYNMSYDALIPHGHDKIIPDDNWSFEKIKEVLTLNDDMEGIVFWKDGAPLCKIKRTDFGLPWPVKHKGVGDERH